MNGPLFWATVFSLAGLCIVILGLRGFRRPPPGFEPKHCLACGRTYPYTETRCGQCEKEL